MRQLAGILLVLAGLLSVSMPAISAPVFPELSGQLVDEATLLSPATKKQLLETLQAHEQASSNQLVVVTLKSLQGYAIEEYGYQLGRHWGIGQKKLNNGILLIVAPNERRVRIEVGYGLEGQLTDVLANDIIQNRILPKFKAGNFEAGIVAGVKGVLAVLDGDYTEIQTSSGSAQTTSKEDVLI